MNRRELLKSTGIPITLFGLAPTRLQWADSKSMMDRRQQLIEEFGRRNVADLAEILADMTIRIEALEE